MITSIQKKKPGKRKWLFLGLGLAATSALSFFGFQYWKRHKQQSEEPEAATIPAASTTKKKTTIAKPKTTAGKGTANSKKQAIKINAPETAKKIHSALKTKHLNNVLGILKTITTVVDYSAVSKEFGKVLLNGVRQTLVNGVLSSFKDEKQKAEIRKAFSGMGLKYDGKKWSLSGIGETLLITKQATKVWKDPRTSVNVPENMVLGAEVAKRGSFSVFRNENQMFLVESQHVTNYKN